MTSAAGAAADLDDLQSVAESEDDLRSTPEDVRRYHRMIWLRGAMTFGAMLLCYYGALPLWSLWIANLILYPEIYLRVHDIGHGTPERSFGFAARFIPVSNPIWGGTRIFAVIHREHHKYLGTSKDPWLPYYMGHPFKALFFNFIEPEYSCYQFIQRQGFDRELQKNVVFNVIGLSVGLTLFGWVYAMHLLSQRVVHCVGIFFFNFYTHRETLSGAAPIGTWERAEDLRRFLPLLRLVWGADTIDGLVYHNRHHCIGQQHVPVHNYKRLADSGDFTRFHNNWPITRIREL